MAIPELTEAVERAALHLDAIARHPDATQASQALQELASHALTHIESLHNNSRLKAAHLEGYTS